MKLVHWNAFLWHFRWKFSFSVKKVRVLTSTTRHHRKTEWIFFHNSFSQLHRESVWTVTFCYSTDPYWKTLYIFHKNFSLKMYHWQFLCNFFIGNFLYNFFIKLSSWNFFSEKVRVLIATMCLHLKVEWLFFKTLFLDFNVNQFESRLIFSSPIHIEKHWTFFIKIFFH